MKHFQVKKVWDNIGGLGLLFGYKGHPLIVLIVGPYMVFIGPHQD